MWSCCSLRALSILIQKTKAWEAVHVAYLLKSCRKPGLRPHSLSLCSRKGTHSFWKCFAHFCWKSANPQCECWSHNCILALLHLSIKVLTDNTTLFPSQSCSYLTSFVCRQTNQIKLCSTIPSKRFIRLGVGLNLISQTISPIFH